MTPDPSELPDHGLSRGDLVRGDDAIVISVVLVPQYHEPHHLLLNIGDHYSEG